MEGKEEEEKKEGEDGRGGFFVYLTAGGTGAGKGETLLLFGCYD